MTNAKDKTKEELFSEIEVLKKDLSETGKALKKQLSNSRQLEEKLAQLTDSETQLQNSTELKATQDSLIEREASIRNKLKAISKPEGDIGTLELSDIIDIEVLHSMMDDFYQLTGMLGAVLDMSGKVLVAVGWQDICTKFHRCNPDTLKNCIESDTILTSEVPAGTFKAYRCKNNMWDIVTPLIVGGKHIGNIFMGQYFLEGEEPDYEYFRKQARKYGFDEAAYLAALDRAPRFTKEQVDAGMNFYSKLARVVSTLSFSSIQQSRMLADRKQEEAAIKKQNQEYEALNEELYQTNEELSVAKNKAEENEWKLKTALGSMTDAIFISDQEGNFIDFNEAFATFHKFATKEECAKTLKDYPAFLDVFSPDGEFVPLEMWVVPKALRGETGSNEEYTLKRKDTAETWEGSYNYSPIRNNKGDIIGSVVTARDITERKNQELKLRESEKKYRDLVNLAQEGIWVIDKNNITTFANPSMAKMLEYSAEEMNGKSLFYFMDEAGVKVANENLERRKAGLTDQHDFEFICKNGNRIYCTLTTAPILDNTGNYQGAIAGVIDMTLRKQAEDQIRAAEENLKNTFDLSPSIICKANLETGYFYEANKAVTRILGYSVEEFTSTPFIEFIHPDDQQDTTHEKDEQIKGKEVTFFENRYLCKDGSYKWMAWHETKADENGIATAIGSDISERKLVEQEIIETKQFYERITEGVQDGIWVTDKDDIIFYANTAMEKIAGVPREKIQGKNLLKDFAEETTGEFINYYKQAKKEKKPVWYDIKVTTPAQKETWQNGWLIPQYQDNKFAGIICTIRDVSERKQAESSVRRLSTAVQQSPSMIVITDTEGIVEYVNPKFTELTGYTGAEVIGQKSNILKSGKQDIRFYKELWEKVKSEKVWRGQFHNKKKNGELFWEAASVSAISNESGDVINFIKIGEDITELKQVENELKNATERALENEEKYRLLHENAGLGIGYYTADGIVISFNSIASKDMNGTPEDFIGKSIFDIFPKESADFYFERIQKSVKSNEIKVYEDCVQLPNQKKWFLSTYTKIVNSKGEVLGIQIISQNITEIKQSETELKSAKEKAEESDRLKSAFLTNMSHEIRTPMNGILGFINLLNEPNLSKSQIGEYSSIINKSGNRLLNTINDIIDISKIEAKEVVVATTEISINTEIEELYSFFLPEANQKGLSLFVEPSLSTEQLLVITDSHKLNGILTNLVKNAIKYTDKGSIILGYSLKGDFIEFYVKDTGIGIPANRIQAIFNRFEQADIEDSRVFQGSGLGLAISKAYAEMLGGEISVTSEEDKGSTFTFTIPYIKTEKKEIQQLPDNNGNATKSTGKLNLLIVEDDEVSSDFLRTILKDDFAKIIYVQDGIKAIESCKNIPKIDLVLMDINLPKMNGYDATREIRKFNKDLLIIAQTAYAMVGDKEKAIEAGCNAYIAKPINKILLLAIIKKLLN